MAKLPAPCRHITRWRKTNDQSLTLIYLCITCLGNRTADMSVTSADISLSPFEFLSEVCPVDTQAINFRRAVLTSETACWPNCGQTTLISSFWLLLPVMKHTEQDGSIDLMDFLCFRSHSVSLCLCLSISLCPSPPPPPPSNLYRPSLFAPSLSLSLFAPLCAPSLHRPSLSVSLFVSVSLPLPHPPSLCVCLPLSPSFPKGIRA